MQEHHNPLLENEHYKFFTYFVLFWSALITNLRFFNLPNDWAKSHWLLSYDFGFMKRGLVGFIIKPFMEGNEETVINTLSLLLTIALLSTLVWMAIRLINKNRFDVSNILISVLFLSSSYIALTGQLNGYFDDIIILIAIMSCFLVQRGLKLAAAMFLSIAFLIHENILLLGLPSVILFALAKHASEFPQEKLGRFILSFISEYRLIIIFPIISFLVIFINQSLFIDKELLREQIYRHFVEVNIFLKDNKINEHAATDMTTSFILYLKTQYIHFPERITSQLNVLQIGIPLFICCIYVWHMIKSFEKKLFIFSIFLLTTIAPLSLHLIASDVERIWSFSLIAMFLGMWGISENLAVAQFSKRKSSVFIILLITILLAQLLGERTLFFEADATFWENFILCSPILLWILYTLKAIHHEDSVNDEIKTA